MQIPRMVKVDERGWPIEQTLDKHSVQLGLPFYGKSFNVDGMEDPKYKGQVRYMGKAHHVFDNTYHCLADVGGALCIVEVTVTPQR